MSSGFIIPRLRLSSYSISSPGSCLFGFLCDAVLPETAKDTSSTVAPECAGSTNHINVKVETIHPVRVPVSQNQNADFGDDVAVPGLRRHRENNKSSKNKPFEN